MTVKTQLSIHDTDADLYAALVRVFGETKGAEHRWVQFQADADVAVNFFAPREEVAA